jgi:hypothetical protein
MQKDLWEHELLKLSSEELKERMIEVSSVHQQLWHAKRGKGQAHHDGLSGYGRPGSNE